MRFFVRETAFVIALAVGLLVFGMVQQALSYSQSFCAPLPNFIAKLASEGEVPIAGMVFGEGIVKMIFANPETRNGTIANVSGDGMACTGVGIRGFALDTNVADQFGLPETNE